MVFETLIRENNVKLYILLSKSKTLRKASQEAEIGYTHARRLVKIWTKLGFLEKRGTLHGVKFIYTQEGLKLFMVMEDLYNGIQDVGDGF